MMGKYANVFMSILEANKMKNININFSLFVYRCVQDLFNHKFKFINSLFFKTSDVIDPNTCLWIFHQNFIPYPTLTPPPPPPQPLSLSLTYISFLSIACKKHSSFFHVIHQLSSLTLHLKSKLLMP